MRAVPALRRHQAGGVAIHEFVLTLMGAGQKRWPANYPRFSVQLQLGRRESLNATGDASSDCSLGRRDRGRYRRQLGGCRRCNQGDRLSPRSCHSGAGASRMGPLHCPRPGGRSLPGASRPRPRRSRRSHSTGPPTRTSTSALRGHAASTTTTTTLPSAHQAPVGVTTTTVTAPTISTVTPPAPGRTTTTTTQPATSVTPGTAATTFSNAGGTITVACQGSAVVLKSAIPADGFQVTVQSSGPQEALVRFTGSTAAPSPGRQVPERNRHRRAAERRRQLDCRAERCRGCALRTGAGSGRISVPSADARLRCGPAAMEGAHSGDPDRVRRLAASPGLVRS